MIHTEQNQIIIITIIAQLFLQLYNKMYANLQEMVNAGSQPGNKFVIAAIFITGLNAR